VEAVLSKLRHRGWKSPSTLSDALYELIALGFLVKTRGGGVASGSKVCSLYAFTDEPVLPFPKKGIPAMAASHTYLHKGKSLAEVEQVLREGFQAMRKEAVRKREVALQRKKATLQKSKRDTSGIGAVEPIDASEVGADVVPSLRKLEQETKAKNRAEARASKGLPTVQSEESAEMSLLRKSNTYAIAREGGDGAVGAEESPVPSRPPLDAFPVVDIAARPATAGERISGGDAVVDGGVDAASNLGAPGLGTRDCGRRSVTPGKWPSPAEVLGRAMPAKRSSLVDELVARVAKDRSR
jgi:hypothetical protein